jgi:hypothetical protein
MKPWVDVVSMNNYRPVLYQRIDYVYQQTDLPVLIGEFSINPDLFKYVPLPDEPVGSPATLERVQRRGEEVLLRASSHPGMVGYTWYRWVANTTQGENYSYGLVNRDDEVEIHVPFLQKVHPRIDPLRWAIAERGEAYFQENSGALVLKLESKLTQLAHVINFTVNDGALASQAFGWRMNAQGIEGQLGQEEGSISMKLTFEEWYYQDKKVQDETEGIYRLKLERDGQYIKGTYTGEHDGQSLEGEVSGYFLPELPDVPNAGGALLP